MLEIKDIEYSELLQRCAYGDIDADGFRFNVGNYVVVYGNNDTGRICIAAVCITVTELRGRLIELKEEFDYWGEVVTLNVYRVVPTCDDEDECDECDRAGFTVLVPYTEMPFREFYAALLCGVVADPYGFGGSLLRGDFVAVKRQDDENSPYRIVNAYDVIGVDDSMSLLKQYVVDGARLLLLS